MSSSIAGTSGPDGESVTGSPEEVVDPAPRPVRRSFTAAYRARVVAEYEAAPRGKRAGLLRRALMRRELRRTGQGIRRRRRRRQRSRCGLHPPRPRRQHPGGAPRRARPLRPIVERNAAQVVVPFLQVLPGPLDQPRVDADRFPSGSVHDRVLAARGPPLGDRFRRRLRGVLPLLAQPGQRQILVERTAAVPDGCAVSWLCPLPHAGPLRDGVASHDVVATGREPGAHQQPAFVRGQQHAAVAAATRQWMRESTFASWSATGAELPPEWATADRHLDAARSGAPGTR